MFVISFIFAIILGYILKGRLRNLENMNLPGIYLIFAGFLIEFGIVTAISRGIIHAGIITYILDLIMYILIFIFIYLNRRNVSILIMGAGFLLNAAAIFLNGGTMPVSQNAVNIAGLPHNISSDGLYTLFNSGTKLWLLGDIIPVNFIGHFAVSIGDIISSLGLIMLIVKGMKSQAKAE